jgi:hypothetical protein
LAVGQGLEPWRFRQAFGFSFSLRPALYGKF